MSIGRRHRHIGYPFQRQIYLLFFDLIKEEKGYLGTYHYPDHDVKQLNVNDNQSFIFKDDDKGPFWMSDKERNESKYDKKYRRTQDTKEI